MNKIFTTIVLAFVAVCAIPVLFLAACSGKDDASLEFEALVYSVAAGENKQVPIKSGNGSYAIYSEDETILLAGYSTTGKKSPGSLLLTGQRTGETWVRVTDKVTGDEIRLRIVVTEPYFSIFADVPEVIIETEAGSPDYYHELKAAMLEEFPFGEQDYMYHLMKGTGEVRIEQYPSTSPSGVWIGSYDLGSDKTTNSLHLSFKQGDREIIKNYKISGNGGEMLRHFFDLDKTESTRMNVTRIEIVLTEDLTEKFKEMYPGLTYAALVSKGEASINSWMDISNYL